MYYKGINGGVNSDFMVGYCAVGNCNGIDRRIGCVLGCLSGLQYGEVRHGNVGRNNVGGRCFSEKGNRGHGGFKVIVDGVYGLFVMENSTTKLTPKMKKFRVISE